MLAGNYNRKPLDAACHAHLVILLALKEEISYNKTE